MKKIIIVIATMLLLSPLVFAETVTLTAPQAVLAPEATKMDWFVDEIDSRTKTVVVRYRWRAADGTVIYHGQRNGWLEWRCRDKSQGDNAACTDIGVPWSCCSGVGTGTCPEVVSTCFSDIFSFTVRAQDVGTSIGAGLRALIWNRFVSEVMPGNNGSFD